MSRLHLLDLPADRMEGSAVTAFFFSDQKPLRGPAALMDWRLNGALTEMLVTGRASGRAGEHILIPNSGKMAAPWILFVGGGSWEGLEAESYKGLISHLLATAAQAGFSRLALCLSPLPGMGRAALEKIVAQALEGTGNGLECLLSLEDPEIVRSLSRR